MNWSGDRSCTGELSSLIQRYGYAKSVHMQTFTMLPVWHVGPQGLIAGGVKRPDLVFGLTGNGPDKVFREWMLVLSIPHHAHCMESIFLHLEAGEDFCTN